jgi:xanthine dehydrogenase accessory factor
MPEACVDTALKDASYLVMTHSHALDQRLTEAILAREDVGWFGLIGSHTKRVQFERRMAARGLPQDRIDNMVCPIGLPGISSKLPAAIAASVCAQLLMVWEQQQIAALNAPARLAVAS